MAKTNLVFSASSLNLFQQCKRKFQIAHLKRKQVPIHERAKPLDRGTLVHKGLEVYFNQLAAGIHFNDRVHNALMKIKETASDATESNIDITEELPIIINSVAQSCEFWRFEDEHLEILAVETPFDYILHEDDYIRIIMSGKVDLLVNKPAMGGAAEYKNLPYDHKSNDREFPTDRLDNQFINYTIPTGSYYLIVNKVGQQKTLKPEEKFKRIPLSYDPLIIEQWKKNTVNVIINEYLPCLMNDYFPMNNFSHRFFGRLCEFYPVCDSSGEQAAEWKLATLYVDREKWDKYAETGDESV